MGFAIKKRFAKDMGRLAKSARLLAITTTALQ